MSDESYLSADRFFGSICRVAFADFSLSFGQGRMGKAQYGLNGIQDRENFRAIRKETPSSLPKGLPVVATNGKERARHGSSTNRSAGFAHERPAEPRNYRTKKVRAGCHRSDRPGGEVMPYLCRRPCISTEIG
jgi:hypothetical protein